MSMIVATKQGRVTHRVYEWYQRTHGRHYKANVWVPTKRDLLPTYYPPGAFPYELSRTAAARILREAYRSGRLNRRG